MVSAGNLRCLLGALLTVMPLLAANAGASPWPFLSPLLLGADVPVTTGSPAVSVPRKTIPDYPAPLSDVLELEPSILTAVRLVGVDLRQGGEKLTGSPPLLKSDAPLDIAAYWCPNVPLRAPLPVIVEFIDAQSILKEQYALLAGPEQGRDPWEPGLLYVQHYSIGDIAKVARQFSGQAFLTLGIKIAPRKTAVRTALECIELRIAPLIRRTTVSSDAVTAYLGKPCYLFPFSTRLGLDAECRIPVREEWQSSADRLVVLSNMDYTLVGQGREVCEFVVHGEGGRESRFSLVAGENTAHSHHDFYTQGSIPHQRAPIFDSEPAGYLSQEELPFSTHKYAAVFKLPDTLGPVRSIDIRCTAETSLNIFGIALAQK